MKRIAVLMTCYNRVGATIRCLEGLEGLDSLGRLDVWLVDDASPDETGRKVQEWYDARIDKDKDENFQMHIILGTGNLFWCKGMHLAWRSAIAAECETGGVKYDFYLWLNDDVRLKPTALKDALADYETYGGVIVGKFSSDESERDVSYSLKNGLYMSGNFVLIPRDVVENVGIICGKYHHQYGDYDYGLRVHRSGLPMNSTTHFCGVCPQQSERYKHLIGRSLCQRIKLLWDPRGYDLHDAVLYKFRNWGFCRAIFSALHVIWLVVKGRNI